MALHLRRLRVFTWHIHGSYLFYLSQGNFDIIIPVNELKDEGYYGRGNTFPFGRNVIEIPANEVKNTAFDCVLFQTNKNYLIDQYEILSDEQRQLPQIYLEHDSPVDHPSNTQHLIRDKGITMVHVTHFNKLMWDNGLNEAKVVEHGVIDNGYLYTGEYDKGIVVVNHLHQRGRKLGADIFEKVKAEIPLDLIGMGTEEYGGLGEILHPQLPSFIAQYRFFFNPIRYTSLGLSVCEAMMSGIPLVALQTTEHATLVNNWVTGFISTDISKLIYCMQSLLNNKDMAVEIGRKGRTLAQDRFDINRFAKEWEELFHYSIETHEKKSSIYQ